MCARERDKFGLLYVVFRLSGNRRAHLYYGSYKLMDGVPFLGVDVREVF